MRLTPSNARHDLRGRKFYPPALPPRLVGGSMPCVRCGYNLKTLHVHWRCPECGLMVDWSVARHAGGRARPWRRPVVAAIIAFAAFAGLGSVDPNGPVYPTAVVAFVIGLLVAASLVFDQLRRNTGRE